MNEELLTMKSQEARIRMREALDAILTGRHVLITRNGHEAAVMVSPEYYRSSLGHCFKPGDELPGGGIAYEGIARAAQGE